MRFAKPSQLINIFREKLSIICIFLFTKVILLCGWQTFGFNSSEGNQYVYPLPILSSMTHNQELCLGELKCYVRHIIETEKQDYATTYYSKPALKMLSLNLHLLTAEI